MYVNKYKKQIWKERYKGIPLLSQHFLFLVIFFLETDWRLVKERTVSFFLLLVLLTLSVFVYSVVIFRCMESSIRELYFHLAGFLSMCTKTKPSWVTPNCQTVPERIKSMYETLLSRTTAGDFKWSYAVVSTIFCT